MGDISVTAAVQPQVPSIGNKVCNAISDLVAKIQSLWNAFLIKLGIRQAEKPVVLQPLQKTHTVEVKAQPRPQVVKKSLEDAKALIKASMDKLTELEDDEFSSAIELEMEALTTAQDEASVKQCYDKLTSELKKVEEKLKSAEESLNDIEEIYNVLNSDDQKEVLKLIEEPTLGIIAIEEILRLAKFSIEMVKAARSGDTSNPIWETIAKAMESAGNAAASAGRAATGFVAGAADAIVEQAPSIGQAAGYFAGSAAQAGLSVAALGAQAVPHLVAAGANVVGPMFGKPVVPPHRPALEGPPGHVVTIEELPNEETGPTQAEYRAASKKAKARRTDEDWRIINLWRQQHPR